MIFFNQRRPGITVPALADEHPICGWWSATRLNFHTPIEDVEFSPDGLWLVFEGRDAQGNRDIYFMTITEATVPVLQRPEQWILTLPGDLQ